MAIQKARIINAEYSVSNDVYVLTEGPDRKGNYLLINESMQRRVRAHPTRILKIVPNGSVAYQIGSEFKAACPQCNTNIIVELANDIAICHDHGSFVIDWSKVDSGVCLTNDKPDIKTIVKKQKNKLKRSQNNSSESTQIDFKAIKTVCEIWTKSDVEFDYSGYVVKAHVIIINDIKHSRKFCFNSYNDTWGKKSKTEDLRLFIANKPDADNKAIGYYLKNSIDHERKKLEKNGYVRQ